MEELREEQHSQGEENGYIGGSSSVSMSKSTPELFSAPMASMNDSQETLESSVIFMKDIDSGDGSEKAISNLSETERHLTNKDGDEMYDIAADPRKEARSSALQKKDENGSEIALHTIG